MNWSVFPKPFRILWHSLVASNSSHSVQLLSLVLSFLLWIFHLPIKKSKSLGEEVFDGIISKSPVALNDSCDITFSNAPFRRISRTIQTLTLMIGALNSVRGDRMMFMHDHPLVPELA